MNDREQQQHLLARDPPVGEQLASIRSFGSIVAIAQPANGARNKMILRYFLFFVAMAIAVIFSASLTTAATALLTSTNSIPTRQLQFEKRDDFFKGKPVPKIDAMSNDTINFTWGLAGVDNVENLKFA